MMKKAIIALLAGAALTGCGGNHTYTLSGKLEPQRTDSVFLMQQNGKEVVQLAAAAVTSDGSFSMKGTIEQPDIAFLLDHRRQPLGIVFVEPGKIQVETSPLGQFRVWGTRSNDAFLPVNDSLMMLQGQLMAAVQFGEDEKLDSLGRVATAMLHRGMEANYDNLAGTYFLSALYSDMELEELRETLAKFPEHLHKTELLKSISQSVEAMEHTEIGRPYREIALPGPDGETIALSGLIAPGKWVLIDFWATWCPPCRAEIPYLKKAYEEFAEKGFVIYGVSLDNDAEGWKNFIAQQQMNWPNVIAVSEGQNDPVVEEYGIRSIPANFLISPDGKIVAKELRGEAIREKLSELLR